LCHVSVDHYQVLCCPFMVSKNRTWALTILLCHILGNWTINDLRRTFGYCSLFFFFIFFLHYVSELSHFLEKHKDSMRVLCSGNSKMQGLSFGTILCSSPQQIPDINKRGIHFKHSKRFFHSASEAKETLEIQSDRPTINFARLKRKSCATAKKIEWLAR
jgi:hypothetical protein